MRNRLRFMLAALAWTAIGAVFALPKLANGNWRRSVTRIAYATMGGAGDWCRRSLWRFDADYPSPKGQLPKRIAANGLPSLIFSVDHVTFSRGLRLFGLERWRMVPHAQVLVGTAWNVTWRLAGYWMILAAAGPSIYERYLSSELRRGTMGKFLRGPLKCAEDQLSIRLFLFNAAEYHFVASGAGSEAGAPDD